MNRRILRSLLAPALILALLAGCQTNGSFAPAATAPAAAPAVPPLTPSAVRTLISARAPADPIAALPQRLNLAPVRGTWTADFIARVYQVNRAARSSFDVYLEPHLGVYSLTLPAMLQLTGMNAELAAFEDQFRHPADRFKAQDVEDRLQKSLVNQCERSQAGCSLALKYRHDLAIILLAAGKHAEASGLLSELEGTPLLARFIAGPDCNPGGVFLCAGTLQSRSAWQIQNGAIADAVANLEGWLRKVPDRTAPIEDHVADELALLVGQGRIRDAMDLIDRISSSQSLRAVVVAPLLFAFWDGAITHGAGVDVQLALAALAERLPAKYPTASAGWRSAHALAVECRATHAGLALGVDSAALSAAYEAALERYEKMPEDFFSTGFCLYNLAPRLQRAADQDRIRDRVRTLRAARVKVYEAHYPKAIAEFGRYENLKDITQSLRAMQGAAPLFKAEPQAYLLIDEEEMQRVLINFLEATKRIEDTNLRRQQLSLLIRFVMWRVMSGAAA